MPRERWQVPPMWSGETVAIIAGGPSAVDADLESLRGRCRVITINNSHLLTPWADILWFCDSRWYTWHKDAVDKFDGLVVTLENYDLATDQDNFRSVHNYGRTQRRRDDRTKFRLSVHKPRRSLGGKPDPFDRLRYAHG